MEEFTKMHVLGFIAENFKRIRLVDITPKKGVIEITGRNGQGKTSVLDALWGALQGKRAAPEKPVRKGATQSKITFTLGDVKTGKRQIVGVRTFNADRTTTIELRNGQGTRFASPQTLLDELMGELAFDPLAFIHMEPKQQIAALRQAAKVDYDFDAATAASAEDFAARTVVNREVTRLKAEAAAITVMEGLPKARVDEAPITAALTNLGQVNLEARRVDNAKAALEDAWHERERETVKHSDDLRRSNNLLLELEKELSLERRRFEEHEQLRIRAFDAEHAAKAVWEAAPTGQFADAAALTQQLQEAQTTNREIDKRERKQRAEALLAAEEKKAADLTRRIERRDEQKAAALSKAKLPVDGLTFDENAVVMNGIPIEQLGEAEQLRISTLIAMSANPKLRVLRIMHGEALDTENLATLAQLAEEHDYQIWMARVDDSGKVGIVMEDGEVKTVNEEEEPA